ncbi:MAG: SDR family oxidoreductase [Bauldia sp.]|uniref:SDR family NAD(P)-dependent oxidoreductase n=1 Tax=Bauldia sp. TaxID=2575872 RepID=UPI001D83C1BF|nr:SDR family oxidoreductase [Bauldia sp.]MCB1496859.1 SDR family oxidoreductase [Bauldia sp.]
MAHDLFSLEERIALVTGGNGGIGRAMARGLAAAGAHVVVTGRDPAKNADAADEFGTDSVFALEVRDEPAVERTIAAIVERFGRLDILLNNAGLFRGGPIVDLELEAWDAVIGAHLTGSFLCARHAARAMIAGDRGGKIINVGSMYSVFGAPRFADYAAAKTGILGLTRSLAVELAAAGIQVNAILPGWFETDLTRGVPAKPMGEQIRRRTPARRWGMPDDLVGTVVYLASPASDFVTGVHIPVDGGYRVADRIMDD